MKGKALLLSALLSVVFLAVWLLPVAQASTGDAPATAQMLKAMETPLNAGGNAFEININADAQGALWISDNGADEILQIGASGHMTNYGSIAAPSDARRDEDGHVWFAESGSNRLGRLAPSTGQLTYWQVPGAQNLYGTQVDAAGRIWLTDFFRPFLYRFDPASNRACTYDLPDDGAAEYLARAGSAIWFGDHKNDRIYRVNPATNTFTYWQIGRDGYPEGLAAAAAGDFWWADPEVGDVARLEPSADRLTRFDGPFGGTPEMLALVGQTVWYSDDFLGAVAHLEPASAGGSSETVTRESVDVSPTCSTLGMGMTASATVSAQTPVWTEQSLNSLYSGGGWTAWDLPTDAFPWGVAVADGSLWVVDNGRQMLMRLPAAVDVTACKQEDADGDLATSNDRSAVTGWPVSLVVDGLAQTPAQNTGADGCYTWRNLSPGSAYGVQEGQVEGWIALTDTSHDFGTGVAGSAYTFTFINQRAESYQYLPAVMRP